MTSILGIFKNTPLICSVLAWVIAQLIKFIFNIVTERKLNIFVFFSSGGMPSSHSSSVCALATAVGFCRGFNSVEFAITFMLAFIVMYDAAGVRRAAGEQAKLLNRIMQDFEDGRTENMDVQLKELIGHTPLQVAAGAILGVLIPVIVYSI